MSRKTDRSTRAAAALLALWLSGCGGGSAGVQPAPMPPASIPPEAIPVDGRDRPGGIPSAAGNRPLAGDSVVQSSNGTNGVTADDISVRLGFSPGSPVHYRVANGNEWLLGSDDPDTETIASRRDQRPSSGLTVTGVLATNGQSHLAGDAAADLAGGVAVVLYTDIESTSDADYLVWGVWVDAPDDVTAHRDIVHGAFATGPDPFSQSNLVALTGTSRYQGDVTGVYFDPTVRPFGGYSFDARVTLLVTFGSEASLGSISGSIDNFRLQVDSDGTRQASAGTVVTLERAVIGGSDSGYFEGTTTGSFPDGTTVSGRWGGRFYGNGESGGQPGAVAGTFGAAGTEDDRGLIGGFGAYRQ